MLMSPWRLVFFRLFNLTIGRWGVASRLLRRVLLRFLVAKAREPYCQSARFFTIDQLAAGGNES